ELLSLSKPALEEIRADELVVLQLEPSHLVEKASLLVEELLDSHPAVDGLDLEVDGEPTDDEEPDAEDRRSGYGRHPDDLPLPTGAGRLKVSIGSTPRASVTRARAPADERSAPEDWPRPRPRSDEPRHR